jgi:hypothetical protein
MSKDWKTERAEAAIKEGTDKIMKAAQKISKKEEPVFKEKIKRAKKSLENVEHLPCNNEEVNSFEICLGVGLNQFFPEYITIYLSDEK